MSENTTNEATTQKEEVVVATEVQQNNIEKATEEKVSPAEFLKNFNWHKHEEGIEHVDENQLKEFDTYLNNTLGFINELEIIQGTVVKITDLYAIINVNSKSEGIISLNEFRYNQNLKEGDVVDVLVSKLENASGQLVLSHKKARAIKAWERIINAKETEEIVQGFIKHRTRGGMIVEVFGIEAFLPGSLIDVKPIRDYDEYVNKTMEFKVIKINHEFKNVVVSHRALIDADLAEQKKEIISSLEKGQVLEGVVKNITAYGVFVDLGGVDGLVHVTDLSWSRVNHPTEILELDQEIKVVILDFDKEKTRIQLGIKQLKPHPWEVFDASIKKGDKIKGKVTVIADYGAFVEVAPGIEGLIHVTEMSWSTHVLSSHDFLKVGDKVEAVIANIDREEQKMSLSLKQLKKDPWTDITEKYPIGSEHEGIIRNYTNFGVFIELEEGIDGLVYLSDLSWTKKIKHPSDMLKSGDKLKVKVMELKPDTRKLNLSHKHTMENPWTKYESTYAIGSQHEGIVKAKRHKGGIVLLDTNDQEVEAFLPNRHMEKEDGSKLKKRETATFCVLEFNKDSRRILVSHTAVFKKEEQENLKTAAKKAQSVEKKPTLGDISGLSKWKKNLEGGK